MNLLLEAKPQEEKKKNHIQKERGCFFPLKAVALPCWCLRLGSCSL